MFVVDFLRPQLETKIFLSAAGHSVSFHARRNCFHDLSNRAMIKETVFLTLEIISSIWRRFNDAGNGSAMLEIVQECWQQFINP